MKKLTTPIAFPKPTWGNPRIAETLTPARLAGLIASANEGNLSDYLTLAEEMEERDPHYASVLGVRKRAIEALEPMVEAASDETNDQRLADAVRAIIRTPEFANMIEDLLDALGKGFAVIKIDWEHGKFWRPKGYQWIDPRCFGFGEDGTLAIKTPGSAELAEVPPYRFLTHYPRLKSGQPARGGLARLAAAAFMAKSYTITDWLAFAEVFGMPLRLGKYHTAATQEDIDKLARAVFGLGADGAAVIPEGMSIEFEDGQSSRGDGIFKALAEYLDKQVSKAVLGQTASSEGTPGKLGNEELQTNVFEAIIRSDAKTLSHTINRDLIQLFIDLNFGKQTNYPRFCLPLPDSEDLELLITALEKLVPLGLPVEASWVRDKFGIPDPDSNSLLLASTPTTGSGTNSATAGWRLPRQASPATPSQKGNHSPPLEGCPPGRGGEASTRRGIVKDAAPLDSRFHGNDESLAATNRATENEDDEMDALREEMLAEWQVAMEPIIDPIEAALKEATSYQDFLEKLPHLLEQMETKDLIEALAKGTFLARGSGDARD